MLPNLIDYFRADSDIRDTIITNTLQSQNIFLTKNRLKLCFLKPVGVSIQFQGSCDRTHYCATEPSRLDEGVCCPSKSKFY